MFATKSLLGSNGRLFLGVLLLACLMPLAANAQYATGGNGLHRARIFWVDWGNPGQNVYGGATITRGFNIGSPATPANRLDITCTLSNATTPTGTAGLFIYAPGSWQGDGLDELYNIGGNQPGQGTNPNMLDVGLSTNNNSQIEFDFNCSATLGGTPFQLKGLVFADAEASGGTEYVGARLTSGGNLRIIDQVSQCGSATTVNVVPGSPAEVRFNGPTLPQQSCEQNGNPLQRAGPALVGYIEGATSARVIARGGGKSAVAVGAVLEVEYSEAIPNSYGIAAHVLSPAWSGGVAATGVNYNNPANLSTLIYTGYLGTSVEPDQNATGPVGGPDVNALPKTSGPLGAGYADVPPPTSGAVYTVPNVSCVGTGVIGGWIDFNGNGVFDASERSNSAVCPSGSNSVSLSWNVPSGAGFVAQQTSYLRLRMGADVADVADPTGVATQGEAEDYRIRFKSANVSITKTNTPAAGANDQLDDTVASGSAVSYQVVVNNAGPDAADGTVLRDPAPTGLTCTTVTCGSETNGAICPVVTVAQLQAPGGVAIVTLPANSSLTLLIGCTVQ